MNREYADVLNTMFLDNVPLRSQYYSYCMGSRKRVLEDADFVGRHLADDDDLLDVGALPPALVSTLWQRGFRNMHVADPFAERFSTFFEHTGIRYHKLNLLEEVPLSFEHQFDFVCLNEVVEHLPGDLVEIVERVLSCLRSGGKLLVTTPNLRSFSGFAALAFCSSGLASKPRENVRAQYQRKAVSGYYGHLREFTSKETIDFFESFGMRHIATSMRPSYWARGLLFRCIKLAELFVPPFRLAGKYLFVKDD